MTHLCADGTPDLRHHDRHWTPARILEAIWAFAETMGRAPTVNDVEWHYAYRRSIMSADRLAEAERAANLGLRLPDRGIVKREFGSWGACLSAAGLAYQAPRTARIHRTKRATQVCPSCGDFVSQIDEVHGWCLPCVRAATLMDRLPLVEAA